MATLNRCGRSPASASGSGGTLRRRWWIACLLVVSFGAAGRAQDAPRSEAPTLSSPTAIERENARAQLGEGALDVYRKALRSGAAPALLIDALVELGRHRKPEDIGLIARHVSSLDPHISGAAVDALKGYGRAGLRAVQALGAAEIDAQTRKQVLELLLFDHIRACCRRDNAVNPLRLDYAARLDELYSVGQPLDDLLLKLLRDSLADMRQDIDGMRGYYGYGPVREQPFIEYGALAVAALARRNPEALQRELGELARVSQDDRGWWGWGGQRAPATMELAAFFARRGSTALMDKILNDLQSQLRYQDPRWAIVIHVQIAAVQATALGEQASALDRLNSAIRATGLEPDQNQALAHYLRARILMSLNEEGAALHALEESMEASPSPPVLAIVDDAFAPLQAERRYRDVLRFCELRERLLPAALRPWRKGEPDPEPEPEPEPEDFDDDE
jgi:hypothetical protein